MWLRTKDGWYIHEIRGAVFVTWISKQDKSHALIFPFKDIRNWKCLMEDSTGKKLEIVSSY